MDKTANPCNDFFEYACGNWNKNNPIPSDQSRWGRFNELDERNQQSLRKILEAASTKPNRTPLEQSIGDYYASCMDEKGIETLGTKPLQPMLSRINGLKGKEDLAALLASLHADGVGGLFVFSASPDSKNASINIAQIDQGGLSLPDRDYYVKDDAKSVDTRQKFEAHVAKMLELNGTPADKAAAQAKAILALEMSLAQASMDRVARRNPNNTYHPMTRQQMAALAPAFTFERYFDDRHTPSFTSMNVRNPEFFKSLNTTLTNTSLDDVKAYLTWKVIHATSDLLPAAFVNENFAFYGRTLGGAKELKPRWKRCITAVDSDLGEALGQEYVKVAFGPMAKQRMADLIGNIVKAMASDIDSLDWMTPATKNKALEKLKAIQNKVGYPENWRDYSKLEIKPSDAFGNSLRSNAFESARILNRIGKAPDPKEWFMTPPTVNAYYSPQQNNINFPAGILQPPFFDPKIDDAVNYGGIGVVIGHEITHGFDDQGRRFDPKGNLADWWTAEDAKKFEDRASCVDQQYGSYTAVEDVKLNGKLTLGENTADNGGLRVAYMALQNALEGKARTNIDGFTPEQRFFLGFAQVWCGSMTDEQKRLRALTDPHSPGKYRVNGTLSNSPEFYKAFGCKKGDAMVSQSACRVW